MFNWKGNNQLSDSLLLLCKNIELLFSQYGIASKILTDKAFVRICGSQSCRVRYHCLQIQERRWIKCPGGLETAGKIINDWLFGLSLYLHLCQGNYCVGVELLQLNSLISLLCILFWSLITSCWFFHSQPWWHATHFVLRNADVPLWLAPSVPWMGTWTILSQPRWQLLDPLVWGCSWAQRSLSLLLHNCFEGFVVPFISGKGHSTHSLSVFPVK